MEPTKYGGNPWKSPKTVKAAIRGSERCRGGFRLDKDKISPDDECDFEGFSYIHINFKEAKCKLFRDELFNPHADRTTLDLNRFEKLWNGMMTKRREERVRIRELKDQLQEATLVPLALN